MSIKLEDTIAAKLHNIFCWVVIMVARYLQGNRALIMSFADPGLLVGLWIIVGGMALVVYGYFIPIVFFLYMANTFYKYNQKKLAILYCVPIVIGLVAGIDRYLSKIKREKVDKEIYNQSQQLKKTLCNEESRNDFFNVLPIIKSVEQKGVGVGQDKKQDEVNYLIMTKQYSLADLSSYLKNDNLKLFVKKYPDFSKSKDLSNIISEGDDFYKRFRANPTRENMFVKDYCIGNR